MTDAAGLQTGAVVGIVVVVVVVVVLTVVAVVVIVWRRKRNCSKKAPGQVMKAPGELNLAYDDDYNHLAPGGGRVEPPVDADTYDHTNVTTHHPGNEYSVAGSDGIPLGGEADIYKTAGTTYYESVGQGAGFPTSSSAASAGKAKKGVTSPSAASAGQATKGVTSLSGPPGDDYDALNLKGKKKAKGGAKASPARNYDHVNCPADVYNVLDVGQNKLRDQQRNVAADEYSHFQ